MTLLHGCNTQHPLTNLALWGYAPQAADGELRQLEAADTAAPQARLGAVDAASRAAAALVDAPFRHNVRPAADAPARVALALVVAAQ